MSRIMRKQFKKGTFKYSVAVLLIIVFGLTMFMSQAAQVGATGDAYFTLSPAGGSYTVGNNLVVTISEISTSGDNVDAAQANLSYPASQLQYKGTSLSGPFTLCGQNSGGSGSVNIGC